MVLVALAVMVADADIQLVAAITVTPTSEPEVFDSVARLVDASLVQARRATGPHATTCCARSSSMCCKRRTRGGGHRSRTLRRRGPGPRRGAGDADRIRGPERHTALIGPGNAPCPRRPKRGLCGTGDLRPGDGGPRNGCGFERLLAGPSPRRRLEWLGRLIDAAAPGPALRAEAQLRRGHLAYWLTQFEQGTSILNEAQDLFAQLGDPLGQGRALRRLGAIAAATDDLTAARGFLEASLTLLDEAGVENEIGTTLLHLVPCWPTWERSTRPLRPWNVPSPSLPPVVTSGRDMHWLR